ncbi:FKBP-type peptidyl-prolyl cis-trans isomerase [Novosphingobium piscinae]|uniref:Peptidyl-prolyl cis-trans isomerase n=1 Tax=Novosphingobium piscinae TaxID=1507448 RepID=A0A7X1FWF1_9SPHN|nr:FKBP-type peptidyl-prolyl cis-trans isomerase [Novosphingobium piscinae]MBC2668243.1 FKBP-type peptidyl-prolyl cis-trans isomerase [Novosphingobium piscinae]
MTKTAPALAAIALLGASASLSAAAPAAPASSPAAAAKPAAAPLAPGAAAIIPLPLQPIVPAAQRSCDRATPSGLGYAELRPGTGPKAGATDYVLIDYIGYLAADGKVFDQNTRTPMKVDGVIPGFGEGLQLMARGAVWRFCIPAALGYGKEGAGPIPADASLVFQVELLDSRTAAEVEAMRQGAAAGAPPPPAAAPAPGAPAPAPGAARP